MVPYIFTCSRVFDFREGIARTIEVIEKQNRDLKELKNEHATATEVVLVVEEQINTLKEAKSKAQNSLIAVQAETMVKFYCVHHELPL